MIRAGSVLEMAAGVLAVLIVVRTFINGTLILDLEERWPWQPKRA